MNLNIITFKDITDAWFPFFYHFVAPTISIVAFSGGTFDRKHTQKEVLE